LPSEYDQADCLADIIENAGRIAGYVAGMDRTAFERNGLVRDAVERCLERICEAAHRLGPRADRLMPAQPWGDIRGLGNRLRHAYDRISLDVLWNTVLGPLPLLESETRQALKRLRPGDGNAA
jgi:uncharacterized protein with HEPN domain